MLDPCWYIEYPTYLKVVTYFCFILPQFFVVSAHAHKCFWENLLNKTVHINIHPLAPWLLQEELQWQMKYILCTNMLVENLLMWIMMFFWVVGGFEVNLYKKQTILWSQIRTQTKVFFVCEIFKNRYFLVLRSIHWNIICVKNDYSWFLTLLVAQACNVS